MNIIVPKKIAFVLTICLLAISCKKDKNEPSIDLESGLYSWLPFNGNKHDSLENNYALSISDLGTSLIADRKGQPGHAIYFDGVQGRIQYKNIAWPSDTITVACWVKKADNSQLLSFVTAKEFGFGMFQELDAMSFFVRSGNLLIYPEPAGIAAEWTHLVATYDAKDISFYINGELSSSKDVGAKIGNIEQLVIGFSDGAYWKGSLDDLRIYGRVLSASEIKALAAL